MGCEGLGNGTTAAQFTKSAVAADNPDACNREDSVWRTLPVGSGRTTMLDSGMVTSGGREQDGLDVSPVARRPQWIGVTTLSVHVTLRPMSGSRLAPRVVLTVAIGTLVVSIVGFISTLLLNILVWDDFDAYGEVPIPGSGSLHLPEGEVTISFHTQIIGSGGNLPVPELSMGIEQPDGVPDPQVTESIGATTTVNSDARIQVWVAQIPAEGTYLITAEGNVGAFVSPGLAFGHGTSRGWLPVTFGVLMAVSILDLIIALFWVARVKARVVPEVQLQDFAGFEDFDDGDSADPPEVPARQASYEPTEDGIRIQQLKTLAALRESGALTEDEFQSEKRRLLDGR
jgi:hypothetical protein